MEKNEEMEDCYNSLSFQYIREVKRGGYCLVCINIEFTGERNHLRTVLWVLIQPDKKTILFKKGEQFVHGILLTG